MNLDVRRRTPTALAVWGPGARGQCAPDLGTSNRGASGYGYDLDRLDVKWRFPWPVGVARHVGCLPRLRFVVEHHKRQPLASGRVGRQPDSGAKSGSGLDHRDQISFELLNGLLEIVDSDSHH